MAVTLTLGGVVFQDFGIPETINSGGDQMLAVHKMPGGNRTIDAMGPDDGEIRWSGRFRGSNAETRALLLDFMRRQGQQQLLTYSLHRYQVIISKFEADFEYGGLEIPYKIACAVVLDETQALASLAVGFVEALASDVVNALGLSSVIPNSAINSAVTGVATAASNYQAGVPNTTNAIAGVTAASEGPLLSSLQSSISGAQSATQAGITSTTTGINTTPVVAGGSPATMASSLSGAASGFGNLNNLYQLSSTLSRMSTNTSNAGH
jgi:hypothetical protein